MKLEVRSTSLRAGLIAVILASAAACGPRQVAGAPPDPDPEGGPGPASTKERSSTELAPEADASLAEIFSTATRCEHEVARYTCPECRYELGVVKLSPDLLASAGREGFATARIASRRVGEVEDLNGEVRLDEGRSVYIGPRAAGVVRRILVDVGQSVRAGDVLFEVESEELSDARAEYLKAAAAVRLADVTARRETELFEKGICPEKDLLEARAALEAARAAERASRDRLLRLGLTATEADTVSVDGAGERSGLMPVRAPFAGTVLERSLNLGALVEPGEKNLLFADTSRVWVMTNVYERELGAILAQQARGRVTADVSVPAFPGRVFPGVVEAVGGTVDEATRTTRARVVVENPDGLLRPGMFARVGLELETGTAALVVPSDAVLAGEGRSFIFVRHDAEYYVRRAVAVGRTSGGFTEIVGDMPADAEVVTRGAFLLKSDILRAKMGAGCAD